MTLVRKLPVIAGIALAIFVGVVCAMVILGRPRRIPPLHSITDPFAHMHAAAMPALDRYRARDGAELSYRTYPADGPLVVVLVHGSVGSSLDMHPLATELQKNLSATVLVPDLRGHGSNYPHGDISYVGQLDDDMVDLVDTLRPKYANRTWVLLGFSSGGGFALRLAGGTHGNLFDRYIVVSPFLRHDAPTVRASLNDPHPGRQWYDASPARIMGLSIFNAFGIHHFDRLPVVTFAVPANVTSATSSYSFRMMENFGPHSDYQGDIRHVSRPTEVLVGGKDELFLPEQFASVFHAQRKDIPVVIVAGMGHMDMIMKPSAIRVLMDVIAAKSNMPVR